MTTLIPIFIVWAIITLLGHLSWVIVSFILRAIVGAETPAQPIAQGDDDVKAAHRVISRMAAALLISPDEARKLREDVDRLKATTWQPAASKPGTKQPPRQASLDELLGPPAPASEPTRKPKPTESKTLNAGSSESVASEPAVKNNATPPCQSLEPIGAKSAGIQLERSSASSPAIKPETRASLTASAMERSRSNNTTSTAASTPKQSVGKSLGEFLADHNIRWGELIAGLLIVVCSIGLVFSLWNTIAEKHRVIPSLIFLAGDAAIFGAGLYTLFRWRLQETSRATLVIATLLVPLGIIAGMSAGGIDANSVALDDPITILAIFGAGAVYLTLIWNASRALVGSSSAAAMTISFAGPAALLPIIPAAFRTWESSAGFLLYGASLAIAVAGSTMVSQTRRPSGNAAGRRMMVIAMSGYSLAVLAGFTAFVLRNTALGWHVIAIAALPGVLILAAAAESLVNARRRPKLALAASVISVVAVLGCGALLIPSMLSMMWLWAWAISFAIAAGLAAFLFRSPLWSVAAAVPVGIACVLCSPAVLAEIPWWEISIRKRLIGGEPMIASIVAGIVTLAIAFALPWVRHKRALSISGLSWLGYSIANAAVLTVAPKDWMGAVESWVLPAMLASGAIAIIGFAARRNQSSNAYLIPGIGSAVILAFWVSIFKPLVIGQPFVGFRPVSLTLIATAISGLVAAETLWKRQSLATALRRIHSGVLFAAVVSSFMLLLESSGDPLVGFVNFQVAISILLAAVISWQWIGLTDRSSWQLAFSRCCLVLAVLVISHRYFHDLLLSGESWRTGAAFWGWAAIGCNLIGLISFRDAALQLIGERADQSSSSLVKRFGWYDPDQHFWDVTSRSVLIQLTTICGALAAVLGYGSLVYHVGFGLDSSLDRGVVLPMIVLVAIAAALHVKTNSNAESKFLWSTFGQLHLAGVLAWIGWQLATRILIDPSQQLVLATSLTASGLFALDLIAWPSWHAATDPGTDQSRRNERGSRTLGDAFSRGILGRGAGLCGGRSERARA